MIVPPLDPRYVRTFSGGTADNIAAMIQFHAPDQGAKLSGQAITIGGNTETFAP